jgi:hypothetical protein
VVVMPLFIPGYSHQLIPLFAVLAVGVILLHRKNIDRLRNGTEPKFSFEKGKKPLESSENSVSSPTEPDVKESN